MIGIIIAVIFATLVVSAIGTSVVADRPLLGSRETTDPATGKSQLCSRCENERAWYASLSWWEKTLAVGYKIWFELNCTSC